MTHPDFSELELPPEAVAFLNLIWELIQDLDDWVDVPRETKDTFIWNALVGLPSSSFLHQWSHLLMPLLASMVMKWKASDTVERAGGADARSYVWRAGYYDLVLQVCLIAHGAQWCFDNGHKALSLYGETLEGYLGEFNA